MEMTYRLTYYNGPRLELQIQTQSATDYALVSDNLFTHGEYETKWDMKSQAWIDKGYFKQCFHEKFKGSSDVIFIMHFISVNQQLLPELVTSVEEYFECMKWESVNFVGSKLIKEIGTYK